MPIANVVSSVKNLASNLGISEFGSSNFMRTEDQFITSTSYAGTGGLKENSPQEVIIACKNKKRRVCGVLNEGIKLSAEAKWEELFGGGITALGGSLINMVNKGVQYTRGTSIQQPWMNRKFWNSTKPFSFSFQMNFISDMYGGLVDVYEPVQALLSFVYPRKLETAAKISEDLDSASFISMQQQNTKGRSGVLKAAVDTFANEFAIPGPAIGYLGDNPNGGDPSVGQGDAVTLVIGNLFAFGGVYIEKVDVETSPNMDSTGYPLWAKCTVNVTVMDVNYCNTDGSFMINQFANEQAALSSLIDSIATLTEDVTKGISNIAKTTKAGLGR